MKKVLFTCALLLTFVAAQANDNVGEKAASTAKVAAPAKQEATAKARKASEKSGKVVVMPNCYALSCKVYCRSSAIRGDISTIFGVLEHLLCQKF
jgi:hypothetical protein